MKNSAAGKGLTDLYEQEKKTFGVRFSNENEICAPKPITKEVINKSDTVEDPILSIQARAIKESVIDHGTAYSCDDPGNNLVNKLGENVIQKLSERLFANIYDDPEDWFRQIFEKHTRSDMTVNFTEYLIQRFGGSNSYSTRKGFPSLLNRHRNIQISKAVVDRWLSIMDDTLDEMGDDIDDDSREEIFNFLKYTAHSIGASQEKFHEAEFAKGEFSIFHE